MSEAEEKKVIAGASVNFSIVQFADGRVALEAGVQSTDLDGKDHKDAVASLATLLACTAYADFVNGDLLKRTGEAYKLDLSGVNPSLQAD